jgi:flagellar motor switch protein FliN
MAPGGGPSVVAPRATPAPDFEPSAKRSVGGEAGSFAVQPFTMDEIREAPASAAGSADISLIADVDLNVRVELGRTRMYIEDVLKLREGSIVPLDKLAGDPVDVFVNGQLLARGEVLVLNDNFCVRISEVLGESTPDTSNL